MNHAFTEQGAAENSRAESIQAEQRDNVQIKNLCQNRMNQYVMGHMSDGTILEGIIVGADNETVTILVVDKGALQRTDEDRRPLGHHPRYFRFRPYRFPYRHFRRPFFTSFIFPHF